MLEDEDEAAEDFMKMLWSRSRPLYELPFSREIAIDAGSSLQLFLGDRLDLVSGFEVDLSVDCGLLHSCYHDKEKSLLWVSVPPEQGDGEPDALTEFLVRIKINFADSSISLRTSLITFTLKRIVAQNPSPQPQPSQKEEMDYWDTGPIVDLSNGDTLDQKARLTPQLEYFTTTGELRLKWSELVSRERLAIFDTPNPLSQIAIIGEKGQLKQVEEDNKQVLVRLANGAVKVAQLHSSLEVRLIDSDSETTKVPFYSITDLTERHLTLKLSVADPESTTDVKNLPVIEVTFWQTDFLAGQIDLNVRMEPGTSIRVPMSHQIDLEDPWTKFFSQSGTVMAILAISCVILWAVTVGIHNEQSLTIWVFLEWLSITAHLSLLNNKLPDRLHTFFKPFLDLTRLNMFSSQSTDTSAIVEHPEFVNLIYGGYRQSYLANLAFVPLLVVLLVLYAATKGLNNVHLAHRAIPVAIHFGVRLFYEAFFEVAIVTLLEYRMRSEEGGKYIYLAVPVGALCVAFAIIVLTFYCNRDQCKSRRNTMTKPTNDAKVAVQGKTGKVLPSSNTSPQNCIQENQSTDQREKDKIQTLPPPPPPLTQSQSPTVVKSKSKRKKKSISPSNSSQSSSRKKIEKSQTSPLPYVANILAPQRRPSNQVKLESICEESEGIDESNKTLSRQRNNSVSKNSASEAKTQQQFEGGSEDRTKIKLKLLEEDKARSRLTYTSLFEGLILRPNHAEVTYLVLFLVRRAVYALTIVLLPDQTLPALFTWTLVSILALFHLITAERIFSDNTTFLQSTLNEVALYALCVTCLSFGQVQSSSISLTRQKRMETVLACLVVVLVILTVVANVVIIGLQIWYQITTQLKRFETQREYLMKLKNGGRLEEDNQNQSCIQIEDQDDEDEESVQKLLSVDMAPLDVLKVNGKKMSFLQSFMDESINKEDVVEASAQGDVDHLKIPVKKPTAAPKSEQNSVQKSIEPDLVPMPMSRQDERSQLSPITESDSILKRNKHMSDQSIFKILSMFPTSESRQNLGFSQMGSSQGSRSKDTNRFGQDATLPATVPFGPSSLQAAQSIQFLKIHMKGQQYEQSTFTTALMRAKKTIDRRKQKVKQLKKRDVKQKSKEQMKEKRITVEKSITTSKNNSSVNQSKQQTRNKSFFCSPEFATAQTQYGTQRHNGRLLFENLGPSSQIADTPMFEQEILGKSPQKDASSTNKKKSSGQTQKSGNEVGALLRDGEIDDQQAISSLRLTPQKSSPSFLSLQRNSALPFANTQRQSLPAQTVDRMNYFQSAMKQIQSQSSRQSPVCLSKQPAQVQHQIIPAATQRGSTLFPVIMQQHQQPYQGPLKNLNNKVVDLEKQGFGALMPLQQAESRHARNRSLNRSRSLKLPNSAEASQHQRVNEMPLDQRVQYKLTVLQIQNSQGLSNQYQYTNRLQQQRSLPQMWQRSNGSSSNSSRRSLQQEPLKLNFRFMDPRLNY